MTLNSLEIIALILIVISAIKITTLLIKPKVWMNFAGWVYGGKWKSKFILLMLAAIVFYFLIQELSIIQILAVTFFVALFIGATFVGIYDDFIKIYKKKFKGKSLWGGGNWLYTLIWIVLMGLGIREILG